MKYYKGSVGGADPVTWFWLIVNTMILLGIIYDMFSPIWKCPKLKLCVVEGEEETIIVRSNVKFQTCMISSPKRSAAKNRRPAKSSKKRVEIRADHGRHRPKNRDEKFAPRTLLEAVVERKPRMGTWKRTSSCEWSVTPLSMRYH